MVQDKLGEFINIYFLEHILSTDQAFWLSPSGNKLAFAVFNETYVSKINANYYSTFSDNNAELIPYAKVGENISTVNLFVWLYDSNRTVKINPPEELQNFG